MDYHELKRERLKAYSQRSDVVSVSNDSKWLYVFEELRTQYENTTKVEVKFLVEKEVSEYVSFFSSIFESAYLDGMSGPIYYSQIEWIKVYSTDAPTFVKKVEIATLENSFVIYGYRRAGSSS